MKKAIIIAGQTGVGKTKIAYNLANKLNSEIICIDTIQSYKDLKICANKPSIFLTKNIKYHNIDILSLEEEINGSQFANRTRETIKEIWSKNKIPILEGGCGFYLKMILTGASSKFSPEEEKQIKKISVIAREIIRYDNNFDKTLQRILKIDKTTPEDCVTINDNYRLEKRLAEALLFGEGAFKKIKSKEEEVRRENKLEGDFYNFFLFCERNNLRKKLEKRCEKMIQDGILQEVSDLLIEKKITPELIKNKSSLFLNAYGILETLNYFIDLLQISHMKNDYLKAYQDKHSKKDMVKNKLYREIEKIFYQYLNNFSISNRQYAKRQATWFRSEYNSKEDYLWIDGENQEEKIAGDILNFSNHSYEEYKKVVDSDENKLNKKSYLNTRVRKFSSTFEMMKDRTIMKKLIEKSFDLVEMNKDVLREIQKNMNDSNSRSKIVDSDTVEDEICLNKDIDPELLKKYLNI